MWTQTIAQGALVFVALGGLAVAAPAGKQIAEASFTSQDQSRCVTTEVFVFVKGGGGAKPKLHLAISQVDECKDAVLLSAKAKANIADAAFFFSPDLNSATLRATVPITDRQTGKGFNAVVNLTWTGIEETVATDARIVPEEPGRFLKSSSPVRKSLRVSRAAGAVTDGTNKNFTPKPADDASLTLVLQGRPKG